MDLSTWHTKPEAAELLGISVRTMERNHIEAGEIQCADRQRDGKRPEPVCNPGDVERVRARLQPSFVMPAAQPGAIAASVDQALMLKQLTPAVTAVVTAVLERAFPAMLERAIPVLKEAGLIGRPEPEPVPDTPWLTIAEASRRSGLNASFILRLIQTKKLAAIRDKAIKVRRDDLDSLDNVTELAKCGQELFRAAADLRAELKTRKAK